MQSSQTKILVLRKDNIGDLICTTPFIRALRQQLPDADIQALVTRYNVTVLAGNPDLNDVHSYQKAKHRGPGESAVGIYWDRIKTILRLRRQKFDWVILPGGPHPSALRFARLVAPRRTLIRGPEDTVAGDHEVEQTCHLLNRMGLAYQTPGECLVPDAACVAGMERRVSHALGRKPGTLIGVHISARKVSQRWPMERFAEFIRRLPAPDGAAFLLFWAPGAEDDPLHPGDDGKAAALLGQVSGAPVVGLPTQRLEELIAGLSICDRVLCADGGAMHVAAALGKPIVCLFGHSDAAHWRPWGVPYRLLQTASRTVEDIAVDDVLDAWDSLGQEIAG